MQSACVFARYPLNLCTSFSKLPDLDDKWLFGSGEVDVFSAGANSELPRCSDGVTLTSSCSRPSFSPMGSEKGSSLNEIVLSVKEKLIQRFLPELGL